ncbi:hypothetical protein [Methanobrevibacter sp.]|uniref:hypothetical protein n=1 Tax=Methanobrevibacter sp. TaxID=66852 RepID=UPI0025E722E5|nr:hypothetical protein [Methanobrevibacter sp.]MBQ6512401.1 hypothetical protein [Methanobrevibacter sp.]
MAIENSKTGEIDKLKSPLKYDDLKVYDIKGSQINCIETLSDLKFIIEPDPNILSEEEILEYAPESREAAKIRLQRGVGSNSDVLIINDSVPYVLGLYYTILVCMAIPVFYGGNGLAMFLVLILAIIPLLYLYYIFNLKQYVSKSSSKTGKSKTVKTTRSQGIASPDEGLESLKKYTKEVEELRDIFDEKEETVRGLIEKRFKPPQITYDRFMATIDKSHDLFYSEADGALNIAKLAVEDTPRVESELENKIGTLKSIIDQIEDLTNELVINISSDEKSHDDVKNLIDDMENLIDSVKEYE